MRLCKRVIFSMSATLLMLFTAGVQLASASDDLPNILFLWIDDLGETDIGVYGNDFIDTPAIDRLAAEGMMWTYAYSASPVCSPTRAAVMSGKHPARVHFSGHITAISRHRHPEDSRIIPPRDLMVLSKDEVTLAEALKPAGYRSTSIGKWHLGGEGHWPTDMGFDENVAGWTHGSPPSHFYPYENPDLSWNSEIPTLEGGEEGEYLADRLTDEAIKFMEAHRDQPFFVYLTHYAVHTPLQAPEDLVTKYRQKRQQTGNDRIHPVYAAMVENLDQNVGRILRALEEMGLEENTVVIFASDNGAEEDFSDMRPYRAGKGHLYEGGLRVPYIMKWPGHIQSGSVTDVPTRTEDIYATIVDIVGEKAVPNSPLDGRSLVPDFTHSGPAPNEVEMIWYYPHYSPQGSTPGATIISGDYKLLEFYDPEGFELYNLKDDPGETRDLSEEMPGKLMELQGKLRKKLHDMNPIMHTFNPEFKN